LHCTVRASVLARRAPAQIQRRRILAQGYPSCATRA